MMFLLKFSLFFFTFQVLNGRPQREEPVPMAGCDPDYGWNDGADGSGKCYRVIKNADYANCGIDLYETGLSWFQAMECCYYNRGYLAEPQNQEEQDKIVEFITQADGISGSLTAYWIGANDLHREGVYINPSGQPFTYTNWLEGEPTGEASPKEDCVGIDSPKQYKWMDLNCTDTIHGAVTHHAICERIPPQ